MSAPPQVTDKTSIKELFESVLTEIERRMVRLGKDTPWEARPTLLGEVVSRITDDYLVADVGELRLYKGQWEDIWANAFTSLHKFGGNRAVKVLLHSILWPEPVAGGHGGGASTGGAASGGGATSGGSGGASSAQAGPAHQSPDTTKNRAPSQCPYCRQTGAVTQAGTSICDNPHCKGTSYSDTGAKRKSPRHMSTYTSPAKRLATTTNCVQSTPKSASATGDSTKSASNQTPLDVAECKLFQPEVQTVYNNALKKLEGAFESAKTILKNQKSVLVRCLDTQNETGTREGTIAPRIEACIKALHEHKLIRKVEDIRVSMETSFSISDGEGHSSGGAHDYVFGRESIYPSEHKPRFPARRVYLEAKQKGLVETCNPFTPQNRKWLAQLVSGIDGLRSKDPDEADYVYFGAVYDGAAMLVGYTTKNTSFNHAGSVHVHNAVLVNDDALKYLLLLIYFSVESTYAVSVKERRSGGGPQEGPGRSQKKGGDGEGDKSGKGVPKQTKQQAAKSKSVGKQPKGKQSKGKQPKGQKCNTTSHVDSSKRHTTSTKTKRHALGILAGPNLCSVPPSPPVERRGLTQRGLEFHEKLNPFRPLNWNDPNRYF
eukprot:m.395149 g.395149  ORF g.395149 m.395149 type:complete len:601 (-) comp16768_c2_seq12:190-1992(-)